MGVDKAVMIWLYFQIHSLQAAEKIRRDCKGTKRVHTVTLARIQFGSILLGDVSQIQRCLRTGIGTAIEPVNNDNRASVLCHKTTVQEFTV